MLIKLGCIEPSIADWASAIVLVQKANCNDLKVIPNMLRSSLPFLLNPTGRSQNQQGIYLSEISHTINNTSNIPNQYIWINKIMQNLNSKPMGRCHLKGNCFCVNFGLNQFLSQTQEEQAQWKIRFPQE